MSELRGKDLGSIVELEDPKGVTWLSFGAIALVENELGIVPVPKSDLEAVKGGEVNRDDFFWAEINLMAEHQSDVLPSDFEHTEPVFEHLDAFDRGE